MPVPDAESLVARLVAEFGYPEPGARKVAAELAALPEPVEGAFASWWATGVLPDESLSVRGYTASSLMQTHRMNAVAAFLTLGSLIRTPERTQAVLARGRESVRFSPR